MDGNGRWAKKRLMPRNYGHRKGVEAARRSIEYFARAGVRHLTLFAFSSENWKRPADEVSGLMELFLHSLKQNIEALHEERIRIRFIGPRQPLAGHLCREIEAAETTTRDSTRMTLNVALNYGGHWDIVNAAQALARRVQAGEMDVEQIDGDSLAAELSLADIPDPDLFIRTGGEKRVSNFLLWQLAYTELYFCDCLWPDFAEDDMQAALDEYARRQRRFGKTGEQIETPA
jgi:undecaprenyl diphosphate synthase